MPEEIPLAGGNINTVVRVGDTVRRTAGPHTPAVHALLAHLATAGFDGAPVPLGLDASGREVLSFLPGRVGDYPLPPSWTTDTSLVAFARFLRAFHDAQEGFVAPAGARWQWLGDGTPAGPVICHLDAAPYNTVLRPDGTFALIDFDLAAPADPLLDVAFAAWKWVPLETHAADLGFPQPASGVRRTPVERKMGVGRLKPPGGSSTSRAASACPPGPPFSGSVEQARRLRLFADGYQLDTGQRARLLDAVQSRMEGMITGIEKMAAAGEPAFVRLLAGGHTEFPRRDLAQLAACRDSWQEALS